MKPALRWSILGVALLGAGWLALLSDPPDAGPSANAPGRDGVRMNAREGARDAGRDGARDGARDASRAAGRETAAGPSTPGARPITERSRSQRDASEILELRVRTASSENLKSLFAAANFAPPRPVVAVPRPAPVASVAAFVPPPPVAAPLPAPTAPPLPFIFVGKHFENNRWEVFVSRGEQTLILRAGQSIDANYRVESVQPPRMVITYLPLDEKQTLNIGNPQ